MYGLGFMRYLQTIQITVEQIKSRGHYLITAMIIIQASRKQNDLIAISRLFIPRYSIVTHYSRV